MEQLILTCGRFIPVSGGGAEARIKADEIVRQGELEASMEKKKAMESIRRDITDVSAAMTEKLLKREMNTDDHRSMIDEFLKGVGED